MLNSYYFAVWVVCSRLVHGDEYDVRLTRRRSDVCATATNYYDDWYIITKLRIVINYIKLHSAITHYTIYVCCRHFTRLLYYYILKVNIAYISVSVDWSTTRSRQSPNLFSPPIAHDIMFKHTMYEPAFYNYTDDFCVTSSTRYFQNLNNVHSTRTILYVCRGA